MGHLKRRLMTEDAYTWDFDIVTCMLPAIENSWPFMA